MADPLPSLASEVGSAWTDRYRDTQMATHNSIGSGAAKTYSTSQERNDVVQLNIPGADLPAANPIEPFPSITDETLSGAFA